MKALPSEAELAAIVVALGATTTAEPQVNASASSRWAQNARREGVRANVPQTWRG